MVAHKTATSDYQFLQYIVVKMLEVQSSYDIWYVFGMLVKFEQNQRSKIYKILNLKKQLNKKKTELVFFKAFVRTFS